MSGASYLLLAVGLSVVLSVVVWLAQRKPKTFMSSIDEFRREMDALAHEPDRARGRGGRADRPTPIYPAPAKGDLARKLRSARRHEGDPYRLDALDDVDGPDDGDVRADGSGY